MGLVSIAKKNMKNLNHKIINLSTKLEYETISIVAVCRLIHFDFEYHLSDKLVFDIRLVLGPLMQRI